ncbi:MAG TPA: phenylalanine--tRNA ligase subunit beta [Bryobacteraceae bacterium]|nr:phenylalanine--tRNA ligase subunit beta [Bryobacteraceae bacterium]
MHFSYNWICELVDGLKSDPAELSRLITMKTAESEGTHSVGEHFRQVRAARVLTVEPIEGSKNRKAIVDAGDLGSKTVVCGAPNCRAGMVTAYVPSGAVLDGREIRKVRISGIESEGMLASGAELGLNRDQAGILELELEPAADLGCAPDTIIEIDNKSLTHRPDLWGHHGMAREVAAIAGRRLLDPVKLSCLPDGEAGIGISVEDANLCQRYSALVFENVSVKPSPLWLQYRLQAIGLNPINNIVDVTNYVMAELSQPMHAFDADKLRGSTIFVRNARGGERLHALNDESYQLNPSNLVIADASGPIALAGVIGGMDSAISPATTRFVLESACFHAGSVRKTSSSLRLRTDASMRFEKSQDANNTVRGLARAVELLREVSPGIRIAGGLADQKQELAGVPRIHLPLDWLNRKLGRRVDAPQVRSILESLEFGVEETEARAFLVSVPSWRSTKDISIKEDLVEEVGRMIGYDSIAPVPPALPASVPPPNPERAFHHELRQLVAAQGFDEVYNYSFLSEDVVRQFSLAVEEHAAVANPIAADQSLLRMSLVPGIWKNIVENSKYSDSFRLFEIGREIHKQPGGLPNEITHVAAAVYSRGSSSADHLFELKALALSLDGRLAVTGTEARPYEHPKRTAALRLQGREVGRLFELHPSLLKHGRAAILDLDVDTLYSLRAETRRYRPIRRFPASGFDLSVVAGAREPAGVVQNHLQELAGPELETVEFVREFTLPDGRRSLSYKVTVAAPDRTLSSEEVGRMRSEMIEGLRAKGYELRV